MIRSHKIIVFLTLFLILICSSIAGILLGGSDLSISDSIAHLFNPGSQELAADIVWKIRLPRVILGILVGSGLASCGAVFQGVFRNPLAEPYTLGVSSGASLGVTLSIILGFSGFLIPLYAFAGSVLSVLLVYSLAARKNFLNSTIILGGVVLSFLFTSIVYFIFSISKPEDIHNILMWLMGDLSSANNTVITITAIFVIPGIIVLIFFSEDLNILTLGDEKAFSLGVQPKQLKRILFIASSLITGSCVASSGVIGFVGILIPHLARKFVGANHRYLIPGSALVGAIFLVLSDTISRVIMRPLELPVGVLTGIIGGSFFLVVLFKTNSKDVL
jgi:iron complex transport system permease protein